MEFGFFNLDCMEGMKSLPDQSIDLAITDPPYGINIGQSSMGAGGGLHLTATGQQRICAPGGGNKTYIPFGGVKKKMNLGGGKRQSADRSPSERIRVGGTCYLTQNL